MSVPLPPQANIPLGVPVTREFSDFEEMLTATAGWSSRCVKLAPGPFSGRITVANGPRVQFGTVYRSTAVLLQGAPRPAGASWARPWAASRCS